MTESSLPLAELLAEADDGSHLISIRYRLLHRAANKESRPLCLSLL